MRQLFIAICGLISFTFGVTVIVEEQYKPEIKFYNQAQQLKTKCEKDLPRSETCVLMYLNPDEIKTLGKDVDKE